MKTKRVAYIDFIKVFAMFIVTIGHCAQALSGQTFPTKIIPNDFFISIHMPLFMIASGFVLNFGKIRETPILSYISSKFKRLIIPMFAWLIIYTFITVSRPAISMYWYLSALFVSLIILRIFASFIQNDNILCAVSLLFAMAVPFTTFSHINFMFPFLIYGYYLKKVINRMNMGHALIFLTLFAYLYFRHWGIEHTVYIAPLNLNNLDNAMITSFILRLLTGITGSTFLFILCKELDSSQFINKMAKYGKYTLIFYTMTFVINGFTNRVIDYLDLHITSATTLEILSITFTTAQLFIIYKFACIIEKHRMANKLLLGN